MGQSILKQTNISELPISGDISGEDYIIVQGSEVTTRVQFKNVYISKENTTFGQEINDLYEKLEGLTSIVNEMPRNTTTYTKSEIDTKLSAKLNTSSSLTAPEIENKYYSKEVIDGKFLSRPLKTDTYSKADIDSKIKGLRDSIESLQNTVQGLYSRIEYLEMIHDEEKEKHFVPVIDYNDLINRPS